MIHLTIPGRVKRGAVLVLAALGLVAILAACTSSSNGNAAEHAAQGASTNLLETNQPLPIFPSSAMRGELITIEAIEALGSPTTTFFFPPGAGPSSGAKPIKTCASDGEPVPNTASLSNPLQLTGNGNGNISVAQMDPNGTYAPTSSSGTFVLCDTAGGGTKLTYWEGDVYAESGTAVWNTGTSSIQDVGPSELPVCTVKSSDGNDGTGLKSGQTYYHCVKA
jgi:hypothetical protein